MPDEASETLSPHAHSPISSSGLYTPLHGILQELATPPSWPSDQHPKNISVLSVASSAMHPSYPAACQSELLTLPSPHWPQAIPSLLPSNSPSLPPQHPLCHSQPHYTEIVPYAHGHVKSVGSSVHAFLSPQTDNGIDAQTLGLSLSLPDVPSRN